MLVGITIPQIAYFLLLAPYHARQPEALPWYTAYRRPRALCARCRAVHQSSPLPPPRSRPLPSASARNLTVFAADNPPKPRPGDTLIALVGPLKDASAPTYLPAASAQPGAGSGGQPKLKSASWHASHLAL